LCERESKALQLQLGDAARQRAGLEEVGRREEADRDAKIEEIAADSTQQSIHRLEVQMGEVKALLRERQRTLDDFLTHLRTLKRSPLVETEEQFLRAREEVEQQNGLLAGNRAAAHEKQTRFLVERERAQEEREMLGTELRTLRDKRVLIPSQFVAVRESLSLSTHIPIEELPFAGELLEVKHEFRAWTGAIERLVHSFGISLLVPEKHYLPVANFINSTHLKGLRFTFHRVSAEACILRTGIAFDVARVSGRLNFKEDHALAPWVKREVTRHFTHVCCPDVERLREVDYGITREGLIRDGASRHVKDDRRAVNDATNFVLGWSVEGKIKALTAAFQSAEKKVTTAEDKASEVGQQVRVLDAQISAVAGLLRVKEFSEIDVKSEQTVLSRLNQEKQELEASSERLKVLRDQLTAAKERVEANRRELDDVLKNIGALESALARLKDTLGVLTEKVQSDATFDPQSYEASFAPLQEAGGLTLANVATLEGQVCRTLRGQIEKREKLATAARNKMLPLMSEFLRDYPEHTAHLRAEAAYAGDFTALRKRIDLEQLRPQQERFDKFVGESLIGDMAMFHCKMLEHEKGLRNRVELVNSALCKVPFTETTHIQIVVRSVRGNEIPQFRAELKECLSGGLNPTAEDRVRIFARIRELMTKFEKDEAWAHRVTDARNWLEFNLRELANADSREVNFYSASSGKSGGQKAKLAFTVLASAIAAQYGLLGTDSNPDAFRLVVIDEAFARTDEANSQRALELFNALGLQLIVVNPFDAKGRIVEEYVESFHLAVNPNGNSSKLRRASRIEYEAARSGADRN
jgi:uncharacterized protein YPO0396